MLRNSVVWFCQLRWVVVGLLGLVGLLGNNQAVADAVGLVRVGYWPFVCMLALAAANSAFLWQARSIQPVEGSPAVRRNLWTQIVMDLLILTAVVHFVGSTTTFIAFAYLFHIVLSCIFFPAKESLRVMFLADGLFTLCVIAEQVGLVQRHTVFRGVVQPGDVEVAFDLASALLIWAAVWYLTSHLSAAVRQRDISLATANRRLLAAQEERARHMLMTTHELKSPFAAVHANAQLLVGGYCGPLNEEATVVAGRIASRCQRLTREIQEMLQLANLNSQSLSSAEREETDLSLLLRECLAALEPTCRERNIRVDLDLREVLVPAVRDHYKMLLGNLLSNAVVYSHTGGAVHVFCGPDAAGSARVTISDEGIGIPPAKLPHIFDEYYRTNEAVQHNPESTGLGLAIVRQVAQQHGIRIRVESKAGVGTTFHLVFPRSTTHPPNSTERRSAWPTYSS